MVRGALRFEVDVSFGEQEVLNPLGVNCLRAAPNRGIRVWGARTDLLRSRVEVRQRPALLHLPGSVDRPRHAVGGVRAQRRAAVGERPHTVTDFLYNEWLSGALLGTTPKEAFFVRCDRSTMTQNDLDNGRLICLIGVRDHQARRIRHLPHRPEDRRRPRDVDRTIDQGARPMATTRSHALRRLQLPRQLRRRRDLRRLLRRLRHRHRDHRCEYRNGNDKENHVRKVPGLHKVGDVTLKRGIVNSKSLFDWIKQTRTDGPAGAEDRDDHAARRGADAGAVAGCCAA